MKSIGRGRDEIIFVGQLNRVCNSFVLLIFPDTSGNAVAAEPDIVGINSFLGLLAKIFIVAGEDDE